MNPSEICATTFPITDTNPGNRYFSQTAKMTEDEIERIKCGFTRFPSYPCKRNNPSICSPKYQRHLDYLRLKRNNLEICAVENGIYCNPYMPYTPSILPE